jgi:hypothetical protein
LRRRFLEEPIQVPPESLLFTVSDDCSPPAIIQQAQEPQAAMEGATCIIEEEFPEEFLHLDSVASIQNTDNQVGTVAEEVKAVEAMDTEDLGAEVEGHPVLVPPPLMLSLISAMLHHLSSIWSSSSSSSS